jgi:hypothetical protein
VKKSLQVSKISLVLQPELNFDEGKGSFQNIQLPSPFDPIFTEYIKKPDQVE